MRAKPVLAVGVALVAWLLAPACGRGGDARPNILLITLDTTRADRLGCYGYDRETSPNLDALARTSTVYRRAVSTSSWTLPAHASLFTGKFPSSHGARYDLLGPLVLTSAIDGPDAWNLYRARGLARGETTLATLLNAEGYRTGAVVGGPWMKAVFGLDTGFEHYDDEQISTVSGRLARDVTDRAIEWVRRHRSEPQFLFLNYYDPHSPYSPPTPFVQRFVSREIAEDPAREVERINALYDAEIAYMDQQIGRLFDALRDLDLFDDTWIIVTSDHGELLGEQGRFGHGDYLTEAELRIPFIVRPPGGNGGAVEERYVQLIDVVPMIAAKIGFLLPVGVQGQSPPAVSHPIFAEVFPLPVMSQDGDWRALYDGEYKVLWNSLGRHGLYRVSTDPAETNELSRSDPERAAAMLRRLEAFVAALPVAEFSDEEATPLDPETMEILRSLGYVQ